VSSQDLEHIKHIVSVVRQSIWVYDGVEMYSREGTNHK
jgi:hypothetical protein